MIEGGSPLLVYDGVGIAWYENWIRNEERRDRA